MSNKYLSLDNTGNLQEVEATASSAGEADAGKVVALDAGGKLDETMMPPGVSDEIQVAVAGEALTENDIVNFYDDTGTLKTRKACAADDTKPAHGYVKAAVENGSNATVYTDGFLPGTGFTKGSKYFLSETPGTATATPPTTASAIVQAVGVAISATAIKFEPATMFIKRPSA